MHKQVSVDNVLISINEGGCSYDVGLCGRWQGRSTTPFESYTSRIHSLNKYSIKPKCGQYWGI